MTRLIHRCGFVRAVFLTMCLFFPIIYVSSEHSSRNTHWMIKFDCNAAQASSNLKHRFKHPYLFFVQRILRLRVHIWYIEFAIFKSKLQIFCYQSYINIGLKMWRTPHGDLHKKYWPHLLGFYFWLNIVEKVPAPYQSFLWNCYDPYTSAPGPIPQ